MKKTCHDFILILLLVLFPAVQAFANALPIDPNVPPITISVADPNYTLFLCHFDGNTSSGGLDADYALGSAVMQSIGGAIDNIGKFGTGSLDTSGVNPGDPNTPGSYVSYLNLKNIASDAGTIEMWIKPNSWLVPIAEVFFYTVSGANSVGWAKHWSGAEFGARTYAWMTTPTPTNWNTNTWHTEGVPVADGNWHHMAWTWNKQTDFSIIYLDGSILGNATNTGPVVVPDILLEDPEEVFQIGSNAGGWPGFDAAFSGPGNWHFDGLIDELRISCVDRYRGQDFVPRTEPWPAPGCGTLNHPHPTGDFDGNCQVNLFDYAAVALQWMDGLGPEDLLDLSENWLHDTRP